VHRMSAGSEFHATGPEKLKARSLNLMRRRGTKTSARSTLPVEALDVKA